MALYIFDDESEERFDKAIELCQQVIDAGYDKEYGLGQCYEKGEIVKKDEVKAVEYYQRAADVGNPYTNYNLGICYYNEIGIESSYENALECYSNAAARGHAGVIAMQGIYYENGWGVEVDAEKAKEFYKLAEGNGSEEQMLGY